MLPLILLYISIALFFLRAVSLIDIEVDNSCSEVHFVRREYLIEEKLYINRARERGEETETFPHQNLGLFYRQFLRCYPPGILSVKEMQNLRLIINQRTFFREDISTPRTVEEKLLLIGKNYGSYFYILEHFYFHYSVCWI